MGRMFFASRRFFKTQPIILLLCLVFISSNLIISAEISGSNSSGAAYGADLSQFNPELIISDSLMYDGNALSVSQIQTFLDSKVSVCRVGYTCLKDFSETTHDIPATPMCAKYTGGVNETSAQIIFKVQATCGVSAKALLVMLQKEQGLVTDDWPVSIQYRSAMGAGCPDTAACDTDYYGFFNQVHYGAYLLKRYTQPPGTGPGTDWYLRYDLRYPVGQTSFVGYNPNSDCDGTNLTIRNQATHALYIYTPYQPNSAALRAGYGTGDTCSAYGNRNFYNYFSDWFGFTQFQPSGYLDKITQNSNGSVRVEGWSFDADELSSSAVVQVLEDNIVVSSDIANKTRSGLNSFYPGVGENRGFAFTTSPRIGRHIYCVRIENLPDRTSYLTLGCREFTSNVPIGFLNSANVEGTNTFRLEGWTFDDDTTDPINVDIFVDNVKQATWTANVD
ncbi:hypothetical protein M2119_001596, partial [Aurantimicrobium minutum]|nr:hypothetical protein [Aurantimicrobium minutum]